MKGLPYRRSTSAIIVDDKNNFLLVQKQSNDKNQWDFPGGGLNDGEDPQRGILRELKEELGSDAFEIIKESPLKDTFDWPHRAREIAFAKHGKWWKGEERFQFIIKFTGDKKDLKAQEEEIREIKWVPYSKLEKHLIFDGLWKQADMVIEEAGLNF